MIGHNQLFIQYLESVLFKANEITPGIFLFILFFIGIDLAIFGIGDFDGKHIFLKKYKFKESALIADKGR